MCCQQCINLHFMASIARKTRHPGICCLQLPSGKLFLPGVRGFSFTCLHMSREAEIGSQYRITSTAVRLSQSFARHWQGGTETEACAVTCGDTSWEFPQHSEESARICTSTPAMLRIYTYNTTKTSECVYVCYMYIYIYTPQRKSS